VEDSQPRSQKPPRPARPSGIVVPHQPTFLQRLGAWIVCVAIRVVSATLRYRWNDPSGRFVNPPSTRSIFALWHNRLVLCPEAHRLYRKRNGGLPTAALVSASKDGGFLAAVLEHFRIQPVRGSSSRRGARALLELTKWAKQGYSLAITPDGPRGPCYVVQEGIVSLAQLTGLPIVPFSYNVRWKIRLNSWDRFVIPLPFSECDMNVGVPIHVPRDASQEQRAAFREQLQSALMELTCD